MMKVPWMNRVEGEFGSWVAAGIAIESVATENGRMRLSSPSKNPARPWKVKLKVSNSTPSSTKRPDTDRVTAGAHLWTLLWRPCGWILSQMRDTPPVPSRATPYSQSWWAQRWQPDIMWPRMRDISVARMKMWKPISGSAKTWTSKPAPTLLRMSLTNGRGMAEPAQSNLKATIMITMTNMSTRDHLPYASRKLRTICLLFTLRILVGANQQSIIINNLM
mmetsp:Transcript_72205/g.215461  ORF Transcript_72205/g.215461 Transcript_72205/m.215461 type:complete len:220 (+) Transcript_72205:572-1231(+)